MVCVSVGHFHEPCKKVEPIEMPFGWVTLAGPRNHVLDGVQIPQEKEAILFFFGPLRSIVSHCCSVIIK